MKRYQQGSVSRRRNQWIFRYREDLVDAATGEISRVRRSMVLGTVAQYPTRTAAREAGRVYLATRGGAMNAGRTVAMADWCVVFCSQQLPLLKPTTASTLRSVVLGWIRPFFQGLTVAEVGPAAAQRWINCLVGQGYKRSSIETALGILGRVLRMASVDGIAVTVWRRNALQLPAAPAVEERPWLDVDALKQIFATAEEPWRRLFILLATTGMRGSEALGLKWGDVDFARSLIVVRRQAIGGKSQALKSKKSAATLPMPPLLRDELAILAAARRLVGTGVPPPDAWLFVGANGRPFWQRTVARKLEEVLETLGLPAAGLHAFRHGFASRLFRAGASAVVVQDAMRHGKLEQTAAYAHFLSQDAVDAAGRAAAALGAGK